MMAWLLVSGAGVVSWVWPDNKKGGKNGGKEERDLSYALLCLMVALAFSIAHSMTL